MANTNKIILAIYLSVVTTGKKGILRSSESDILLHSTCSYLIAQE